MTPIHIRVLRHSAFYSPLLLAIKAGYLQDEGLSPSYDIASADRTVEGGLLAGEVQVASLPLRPALQAWQREWIVA